MLPYRGGLRSESSAHIVNAPDSPDNVSPCAPAETHEYECLTRVQPQNLIFPLCESVNFDVV